MNQKIPQIIITMVIVPVHCADYLYNLLVHMLYNYIKSSVKVI